ncbi:MAG: response regulator, partial [Thioalkalivibrio sp.]|nr:response regulator [Thioalkalivibrio sp.]
MERSVFLVEDEPALRGLLAAHLRSRGYRVLEAGDAEAAVRYLIQEPPFDLLITDVHLPNLSGIELLRLLQAHSPMKPVLVITGDDDSTIAEEAIGRGAAGYLLKPFELAEMDAAVAQALRHLELIEKLGEAERTPPASSELGIP